MNGCREQGILSWRTSYPILSRNPNCLMHCAEYPAQCFCVLATSVLKPGSQIQSAFLASLRACLKIGQAKKDFRSHHVPYWSRHFGASPILGQTHANCSDTAALKNCSASLIPFRKAHVSRSNESYTAGLLMSRRARLGAKVRVIFFEGCFGWKLQEWHLIRLAMHLKGFGKVQISASAFNQ